MESEQDRKKYHDYAIAFFKEAKDDFESARELVEKGRYAKVVYLCQQCVEKSTKALLEIEELFVQEHDLSSIIRRFIQPRYKEV